MLSLPLAGGLLQIGKGGDADDLRASGPRQLRHFHAERINPGGGGNQQAILGPNGIAGNYMPGIAAHPFHLAGLGCTLMQHGSCFENRVNRRKSPRPIEQLLRQHMGMAAAKHIQ